MYRSIGITKQGVHDLLKRMDSRMEIEAQLELMILKVREDHPTMGVREMYYKLRPYGLGRDRFEQMCMEKGYRVKFQKNYRRTTDSQGVKRFSNLLKDLNPKRMNEVWVSDITYFEIGVRFYYITLIPLDLQL